MTETTSQRPLAASEMVDIFRIKRVLGSGGFGITYLATDTSLNVDVAMKEYFPRTAWRDQNTRTVCCYAGEAEQIYQVGLQRFYKEGQILAQFNHPNIVRVRRQLTANGTAYLVMDYENGETLDSYLQQLGKPLNYYESEAIFNPLLDGLRAVHDRNLLHLDIKPSNIFLRSDSTPLLIDFGGARHQLGQASRLVSFLVASDGYAPNEQYSGSQLQPSTDIYAIGAAIYYSITLRVPADAPIRANAMIEGHDDPLKSVSYLAGKDFPPTFLQAVDSALSMRIANRPQSVRELQQRLFTPTSHSKPSVGIDIPPVSDPPKLKDDPPDNPRSGTNWMPIVASIGGIIALLLLVVLINMPQMDQENSGKQNSQNQEVLKEAQLQAEAIKRDAEIQAQRIRADAQKELDKAKRTPVADRSETLDATRKKNESDNLIRFVADYYAAIAVGDANRVQMLWKNPESSKAQKAYKNVKKGGGGDCEPKKENTTDFKFDSSFTQANIRMTVGCNESRQKRGYQEYTVDITFEKNESSAWRITDFQGVR
ncbi:MAG: protein kinase [Candidatus Contendobacter sp.]|nr:protein kinase [Candidatus Contendobacter sp.]